ncbi:MAG: DUF4215 domain-containing protein [Candidatus Binatia bacterium]
MIPHPILPGDPHAGPRALLRHRRALFAALLGLALAPAVAGAHGTPIALDFWGDFVPRVARCQRTIAREAAMCGLRAWRAHRDCRLTDLQGGSCDIVATKAAVDAARVDAISAVAPACPGQDVNALQFLDVSEAQQDIIRFCRDHLERPTLSAVFDAPERAGIGLDADTQTCVSATADAVSTLLHRATRARQRTLDFIAQQRLSPAAKRLRVTRSTTEIARTVNALSEQITARCPAPRFEAIYGRDAAALLTTIATRADCLAGDTYAQGTILCPASVCGNGMREPQEDCDDGNTRAGDGCDDVCEAE